MPKRNTIEQVRSFIEKEGYFLLSEKYESSHAHLRVVCPNKHEYKVNFSNFKTGKRCALCQTTHCYNTKKMKDLFKKRDYILLDNYKNPTTNMVVICPNGHNSKISWNSLRRGRGCFKCQRVDPNDFLALLKKFKFELLERLDNFLAKKKYKVRCSEGHKVETSYWCLTMGNSKCGQCRRDRNLKKRTIKVKKTILRSGYRLLSKYINNRKHIKLKCPNSHEYDASFDNFLAGRRCPTCSLTGISRAELELLEWTRELGLGASKSNLEKCNLEIDIYVPSLKIGIEYCGLYWHSEKYRKNNYHHNKMLKANEEGIRLITIFEDEWLERESQVKGFLKSVLGITDRRIYARKCAIKEVDKNIAKNFLDKYHIQGSGFIEIAFGLYFEDELLGLITGNKHHRQQQNSFVLNRLVFKEEVQIIGGASRLLKYLIKYAKDNGYQKLISWSDNRWSEGRVYEATGFKLEEELSPDYSYVNRQFRLSKQSCTKKNLLKRGGVGDTEREISQSLGYLRIYDCGKKRWIYDL